MTTLKAPLPIDAVLDDLAGALRAGPSAVLVAPPGAGKTTRVPLALLGEPWRGDGKILVLEPRRLAARNAAQAGEAREHPHRQWWAQGLACAERAVDRLVLHQHLHALGDTRRELASRLHTAEVVASAFTGAV